jgi:hypothetical protein
MDERRESVSSSTVRNIIAKYPRNGLLGQLEGLAMNLELLLRMLGLRMCVGE